MPRQLSEVEQYVIETANAAGATLEGGTDGEGGHLQCLQQQKLSLQQQKLVLQDGVVRRLIRFLNGNQNPEHDVDDDRHA